MDREENHFALEDNWFSYVYLDGFVYFSHLIDTNELSLEKANTKEIVKESFINR